MNTTLKCFVGAVAIAWSFNTLAADVGSPCIFGENLNELLENKRFSQKILGETFKLSREKEPIIPLLWVRVTELQDKETKRVYQLNTTHHDNYDGGNTLGWIEIVTNAREGIEENTEPSKLKGPGEIVAEIHDSEIRCRQ